MFRRIDQDAEVIYEADDGRAFVSPDGEGRVYYDSVEAAKDDYGDLHTVRVVGEIEDYQQNKEVNL